MKKTLKWVVGLLVAGGVIVGLSFAYLEGRKELAREREREKPVKTPPRAARSAAGEPIVKLEAETRERARIATEPIVAATHAPETKAFGTMLDPAPLVVLHGELVAAEVALNNSNTQLARTKALFDGEQNTSKRALEAAEAQQHTDAAKLLNAQQRWALATADAAAKLTPAERDRFVTSLVARELALARVEVPAGEAAVAPTGARVVSFSGAQVEAKVRAIYAAPSVDPSIRGQSFLLVVEQPGPRLATGAIIRALLTQPGEPATGVRLPAPAVVRAVGLAWAYVQTAEGEFTRREVSTAAPLADGWFVTQNFKPGDRIVVTGAQTLLSEEFKSQISVGDEAGK